MSDSVDTQLHTLFLYSFFKMLIRTCLLSGVLFLAKAIIAVLNKLRLFVKDSEGFPIAGIAIFTVLIIAEVISWFPRLS